MQEPDLRRRRPPGLEGTKSVPIDRVHGGADEGAIDFSVSINPLGPPPAALEAYHASAAKINCYPPVYPGRLTARLLYPPLTSPATIEHAGMSQTGARDKKSQLGVLIQWHVRIADVSS